MSHGSQGPGLDFTRRCVWLWSPASLPLSCVPRSEALLRGARHVVIFTMYVCLLASVFQTEFRFFCNSYSFSFFCLLYILIFLAPGALNS